MKRQIAIRSAVSFRFLALLLGWALSAGDLSGADKSGVSANTISLPSGPGSIEGLGEAFQPVLNTGTASHRLPLKLSPGTAGHQPGVSLQYEGGGGNGPIGYGWSLSMPSVQRQTDKGIPRYVDGPNSLDDDFDGEFDEPDEVDRFINDGSEELVPVIDGPFTNYFCRTEGSFIRYRRVADYWEGVLPNGTRMIFGQTDQARMIHAEDPTRVFRWLLESEVDTHGNTIRYRYASFADAQNSNQKYCSRIEYGPGAPPWTHFHFVAFEYEDRADWFEDCRSGFQIRTGKRLKQIRMGTQGTSLAGHGAGDFNGDGTGDYLNRAYALAYQPSSFWSLLESVTPIGADGVSSLPPSRFKYTESDLATTLSAIDHVVGAQNEPPVSFDLNTVDLTDLNGDALPDLLQTLAGIGHRGFINGGERRALDGSRVIQWTPAMEVEAPDPRAWLLGLEDPDVHLSDMDGDGLADLVETATDRVFYYANKPGLGVSGFSWGARAQVINQEFPPPSPFADPTRTVRTADLDFNKRTDIIKSIGIGAGYQIWFNLGEGRYSRRTTVAPVTSYDFTSPGVEIADFNGDRVPDIARIRPASITVTVGLGHGQFAPEITVPIPDSVLTTEQLAKAALQDVTGDGLVDLVIERAAGSTLWFWVNRGNYTLENRREITGLPAAFGQQREIRWVDLNGNGTTDLVSADRNGSPKMLMVDVGELMGCVPQPHLLTRIDNGIGGITRIIYQTSTAFMLADGTNAQGSYQYSWAHPLPFPVEVVSRVENSDSLGHTYATDFKYHDGYYDPEEKQFRGFARAEQIDRGDVTAPTLVTRSTFDVGANYRAMKGKLLALSVEQEDGARFLAETTSWQLPPRTLYTSAAGKTVEYAFPIQSLKNIVERGQGTERFLEQEFAQDNYGNQTRHANYGIVEPGNRSAFNDERFTVTEYALNLTDWIVQEPSRVQIMDEHNVVISRIENYYDDPTFSGNNLGTVSKADLTLTRAWSDPAVPGAFVRASRVVYNAFGNPTRMLDPLSPNVPDPVAGHYREIVYDPAFASYPEQEIIHVGNGTAPLVVQAAYDKGFGTVINSTDMNGHQSVVGYDAFARPIYFIQPGDTPAFPTKEYSYFPAVPFGATGVVNYVESRSLDKTPGSAGGVKRDHYFISRSFSDGLGRGLMTKQEAGPDPNSGQLRVSVKGAVTFNARRGAYQQLNPYYAVADIASGGLDFESIEAPGWQGRFHESGNLVTLALGTAHQHTTLYDAQLRPLKAINPDGSFSAMTYEPLATRAYDENDTDPASPHFQTPTVSHTDGLGRLIRTDQIVRLNDDGTPSGTLNTWSVLFQFDLNDLPTAVTDAQGNIKTKRFDGLKRMVSRHDPDQGLSLIAYDDASNLLETTDAKGQRTTYTYDGVNRLLTEDYHDEGLPFSFNRIYNPAQPISASNRPDVLYRYDDPVAGLDLGDGTSGTPRNTRGRIASVIDLSGEEHTSYDERGRVEYEVKRVPDFKTGQLVACTTRQTYDSMGRVVGIAYPDNDVIQYAYNERSLVSRIFGDRAGDLLASVIYTPSDVQQECRYGNGTVTRRTFDRRSRMESLVTLPPNNPGSPLIHYGYAFDKASNLDAIDDLRPQISATNVLHNSQVFQYDDLYRLVQYRLTDPGHQSTRAILSHRYDRIGNMLFESSPAAGQPGHIDHDENGRSVVNIGAMISGGTAGAAGRSGRNPGDAPGPGALTSTGDGRLLTYDDNGNVTSLEGMTNTWDYKNRLVAVEDAKMRAEYTYDHSGQRITKKVTRKDEPATVTATLTTVYVNKGFEVRENEQPTKYVFDGNTRVAQITGSLSAVPNRVQRLTVREGWNLLSLAVQSANAVSQLGVGINPAIEACYRWIPATRDYLKVNSGDPLPAGSVFWLRSTTNQVLKVTGVYTDPTNQIAQAGGDYVPGPGLEAWSLEAIRPETLPVWFYETSRQRWFARLPDSLFHGESPPANVSPGKAVFVQAESAAEFQLSDPALRIRYYHQDHLGSSSVITGADGSLIEESVFYPFGHPRHRKKTGSGQANYLFTQKEQDEETGLDYFGARYYAAPLARWLSVDPSADSQPGLTPYHYIGNRPLTRVDPDGRDPDSDSDSDSDDEGRRSSVHELDVPDLEAPQDANEAQQVRAGLKRAPESKGMFANAMNKGKQSVETLIEDGGNHLADVEEAVGNEETIHGKVGAGLWEVGKKAFMAVGGSQYEKGRDQGKTKLHAGAMVVGKFGEKLANKFFTVGDEGVKAGTGMKEAYKGVKGWIKGKVDRKNLTPQYELGGQHFKMGDHFGQDAGQVIGSSSTSSSSSSSSRSSVSSESSDDE